MGVFQNKSADTDSSGSSSSANTSVLQSVSNATWNEFKGNAFDICFVSGTLQLLQHLLSISIKLSGKQGLSLSFHAAFPDMIWTSPGYFNFLRLSYFTKQGNLNSRSKGSKTDSRKKKASDDTMTDGAAAQLTIIRSLMDDVLHEGSLDPAKEVSKDVTLAQATTIRRLALFHLFSHSDVDSSEILEGFREINLDFEFGDQLDLEAAFQSVLQHSDFPATNLDIESLHRHFEAHPLACSGRKSRAAASIWDTWKKDWDFSVASITRRVRSDIDYR